MNFPRLALLGLLHLIFLFPLQTAAQDNGTFTPRLFLAETFNATLMEFDLSNNRLVNLFELSEVVTGLVADFESDILYWSGYSSASADIFTTRGEIWSSSILSPNKTLLTQTNPNVTLGGIDVDDGVLFWIEVEAGRIISCKLPGCSQHKVVFELIANEKPVSIERLDVDSIGDRVFFSSRETSVVYSNSYDGDQLLIVAIGQLSGIIEPFDVKYDPINNYIYWSDWASLSINRCIVPLNMQDFCDKDDVEVVSRIAGHPDSLALDNGGGRIYWLDIDIDLILSPIVAVAVEGVLKRTSTDRLSPSSVDVLTTPTSEFTHLLISVSALE